MPTSTQPEGPFARARLVALDVDGTLTDGRILYSAEGDSVSFDVRDGIALEWLARAGIVVAWISGRSSAATAKRAERLRVREVYLGVEDKRACLEALQAKLGISVDETIAMGDDLPDLALAARARTFVAPADARAEVLAAATHVMSSRGGRGAVRELTELILRARGEWDALVERHRRVPTS
jgi:3-deoxy-D-manno-octulosonate 8-phosphate phosphatase (KDO 8-P phosphatase)